MSNITLFELASDYREVAEKLADLDLDATTIADTLEGISGALEVKATNVAFVIRNFETTAAQIKEAEVAMAARRKAIENRVEHIKDYLLNGMQYAGIHKVDSPYFKISVRDNPPSVLINEPGLIPNEYMRQPEPPPPAPDKKLIAQAIKDGVDVPGAHLVRTQRIEIK